MRRERTHRWKASGTHRRGALGWLNRVKHDDSGQALTEFVVVAPVLVMILLFSMWLWEIVQIKLKVQEAARYAAWEATAYPLTDYASGGKSPIGAGVISSVVQSPFFAMQTKVSTEAMVRYANLDAATMKFDRRMLMATWKQPEILIPADCSLPVQAIAAGVGPLCGNLEEPIIYGGPWASMLVKLGVMIFTVSRALSFRNPNAVAHILIGTGGGNAFFGGGWSFLQEVLSAAGGSSWVGSGGRGGAALSVPFGGEHWGFNHKGYVRAVAMTKVRNDWFNVRVLGKPLFGTRELSIMSHHAVLADSWRLQAGTNMFDDAERIGRLNDPAKAQRGFTERTVDLAEGKKENLSRSWDEFKTTHYYESGKGAYWDQVNRLYLARPQARRVFNQFVGLFRKIMGLSLRLTTTPRPSGLRNEDWNYPALSSWNYKKGKEGALSGPVTRVEDVASRKYHTAPFVGEYARTFEKRGDYFMGCPRSQQLGCTDSLAQDDPFGAYVRREPGDGPVTQSTDGF